MTETCNICCRRPESPWRTYDERGKVINGCVDACHSGRLVTPSESASWHARKEAKAIRKAMAQGVSR
jgi:hypothetical protein